MNTNIVYAIVDYFGVRLPKEIVFSACAFYMTLALTSLAVISLIAHSPVGARVINYVFGY